MKRADLSGTELAQQAGAHPAYISAIRRGDRSRMNSRTAARIEAALSVPSGTVFSTEEYRRNGRRVGDE
jgi:transcriptional regulator with XRE-family HTH domain